MSEVTQTLIDDAQAHSQSEPHHRPRFTQRFLALLYVARIVEL